MTYQQVGLHAAFDSETHRARRGIATLSLFLWLVPTTLLAAAGLRVTHIANEGFLVEGYGAKVIVDGLFDLGIRGYEKIPSTLRPALEAALPPFDDVDLILATHHHADHFGPKAVAAHLRANTKALFVSTPQAVGAFRDWLGSESDLLDRARSVLPAEGSRETIRLAGMTLEVLFLHHGNSDPNLGFLVKMGDMKWLHIGDTEAARKDFRPYDLQRESIDLAFLPSWFLSEKRWTSISKEEISPRKTIVMHLAEQDAPASYFGSARTLAGRIGKIHERFPEAVVLGRGESLVILPASSVSRNSQDKR